MASKMEDKVTFQDIMPFESIQIDLMEYFYLFAGIILVAILFRIILTKVRQPNQKMLSKKEISLYNLQNLDLNREDQKQVLYDFTLYSKELLNGQEDTKLQNILEQIETYKYHDKNIQIDSTIRQNIKRYIDELKL